MKVVWFGLVLAVLVVVYRILPHPSNVTPLAALSLLAVSQALKTRSNFVLFLPLLVVFASDLALGFYPGFEFVYAGHLAAALCGLALRTWSPARFVGSVGASALVFFALSNFGVWLTSGLYPLSLDGLLLCYAAALPFLKYSLVGDFVFAIMIFGAFRLCCSPLITKETRVENPSV